MGDNSFDKRAGSKCNFLEILLKLIYNGEFNFFCTAK